MSLIGIEFRFPDWEKKLKSNMKNIDLFVAAQMQFNRGMLFDKSGNYNGHEAWKPLAFRSGQPLSKTGALRKSMAPSSDGIKPGHSAGSIVKTDGGVVTIGTTLPYAWLMNWGTTKLPGGVLKATNAKALKIPIPGGKGATKDAKNLRKGEASQGFIFRKSVKIPERHFDDWTLQDQRELEAALTNKVMEILNG